MKQYHKKQLNSFKHLIAVILTVTMLLGILTGCADSNFKNYRPIDDLDNLDGRKIGVGIGWCSDYLLSNRDDLILYRYDTTSDMLLALCYKQLDAVAVDFTTAKQILSIATGLRQVDGYLIMDKIECNCSQNNAELCKLFNEWLAEFKTTDRYADWLDRFYSFEGDSYEWEGEELTGTGDKYTFATYSDWYPFAYINTEGKAEGYEVEFMTMFANDMNLDVTFVASEETDLYAGISNGMYDMIFGNMSSLYREEEISLGYNVTDSYYEQPIVVLEISDPDNLGIAGVEELD